MSDKGKAVKNYMTLVRCPVKGDIRWANNSRPGPRCTGCGQTGHDEVMR